MSVLVENEDGFVISHEKALKDIYTGGSHYTDSESMALEFKTDLFNITTPYKMDSQLKAALHRKTQVQNGDETGVMQSKKKRKRKEPLNEGETAALEFHEERKECLTLHVDRLADDSHNKETLHRALASLVNLAKDKGFFLPSEPQDKEDNNEVSRIAASAAGPRFSLVHMCTEKQNDAESDQATQRVLEDGNVFCKSPVGALWQYIGDIPTVINIVSEKFVLPPKSSFLLSDIKELQKNSQKLGKYDLIVIDPPWQNKSAKRQKMYWTMKNEDLLDLPVTQLVSEDCLVVVWATNKQAQHRFIHETLFPAWNVKFLTHWFWLKVTKSGETVYDMDSPQKKPYESIIIGHHCNNMESCHHVHIPDKRVLISVPCGLHSKKPPLMEMELCKRATYNSTIVEVGPVLQKEVLKKYLQPDPKCLELFARNLWPGWTSWGNECGFYVVGLPEQTVTKLSTFEEGHVYHFPLISWHQTKPT